MNIQSHWRLLAMLGWSVAFGTLASALPTPPGSPSPVTYNPVTKIVQGNQPLASSYVLTITSPANLAPGVPVTVALNTSVLAKPATGVTDSDALSFVTLTPASLTFTGPNQQLATTVAVVVPLGNFAGDYAYHILPSGWPVTTDGITDNGATVNALVSPPGSADTSTPAITLLSPADSTVYTYSPATGTPVTVPVSFAATVGTGGQPIAGMAAFINANPIDLTTTGLLTASAASAGSVQLTAAGTYKIDVQANNTNGTSATSATVTVVVDAPPPTLAVAAPTNGSTYVMASGATAVAVPVNVTATSIYGNVTALAATLDGAPITLNLSGVGSALTAAGSASLNMTAPGAHVLSFSAANDYGSATPVTVSFTVAAAPPVLSVAFQTPADGTVFARQSGDPATAVAFTFTGSTTSGSISSVNVMLDGTPVTAIVAGLNSATVSGSGTVSFSVGGSHTLTATIASGGATASATTTFSINQTTPPVCEQLTWLPPISLNKTIQGGSTMPIKFALLCGKRSVTDTSVLIAIYEVFADGSTSNPTIYPYGRSSNPNPPDYAINGGKYQLNFTTANGIHDYRIEVYTTAAGVSQLLASKDLYTNGSSGGCRNGDHSQWGDDHDHSGGGGGGGGDSCGNGRNNGGRDDGGDSSQSCGRDGGHD